MIERLFHGSRVDIEESVLEPRNESYEFEDYVFAADTLAGALVFSGNPWNSLRDMKFSIVDGEIILTELREGAFERIYNRSSFVYIISGNELDKFQKRGDMEYLSRNPVCYSNKLRVENVLDTLKDVGVTLIYH